MPRRALRLIHGARSDNGGEGSRSRHLPPLVSRAGDAWAVAADAVDDLVGGLGPPEGPGIGVPGLDPVFQGGGELVERAEYAAVQAAPLQLGEPPFHLADPR